MTRATTIHDAIREARLRLQAAGLDDGDAAFDAELLARHALGGWERGRLVVERHATAPPGFLDAYGALVSRRERREPAAYLVGVREFWELDMTVGPGVLVPRPETELIVEEVLARVDREARSALHLADVGTGSGCLAVALARSLPHARVVATDVSEDALEIARRNADRHGVADRVTLVRADLLSERVPPFDHAQGGPESIERPNPESRPSTRLSAAQSRSKGRIPDLLDVIVSNPPYVPSGEIDTLQPEVRDFEPRGALDGGADGLDVIRRLVPEAAAHLTGGGLFVCEFGFGEEPGVKTITESEPRLELVAIRTDYAGIPRIVIARCVGGR